LGIDVLHTPQEHADFIQEFGAYLAGLNLPTRMLLGDNSDATTFDFCHCKMDSGWQIAQIRVYRLIS